MRDIDYFFDNIIARQYLNTPSQRMRTVDISEVTDIYLISLNKNKDYLLGKTNEVYFIIKNEGTIDYSYSIVLMHHDPITLLGNFKNTELLNNETPESFWNKVLFNYKLEKELVLKEKKKVFKI